MPQIVLSMLCSMLLCLSIAPSHAQEGNPSGSVVIELTGSLPLNSPFDLFGSGAQPSLHDACELVRRAFRGAESRIIIDLSAGFAPGLAAAEELADTIRRKPQGKTVAVLLENIEDSSLIVAAAADEVVAAQQGLLLVDGVSMQLDHYKGLLDKLGVKMTAVTSGPEKTAPEVFTRTEPSEAALKEYTQLMQQIDSVLLEQSARADLGAEGIRQARAQAPQTGWAAVELGIADQAVDPGAWLASQPSPRRYIYAGPEAPDLSTFAGAMAFWGELLGGQQRQRPKMSVAVVQLSGMIIDGRGDLASGTIFGHTAAELLDDLASDPRIIAVVLRIDSGGGTVSASDRIYQAVRRLDAVKPVVALFDGVAASGGYYIGAGARQILCHAGTITGSIGVFGMMPDLHGTREMLGIHRVSISSDPVADFNSTNAMSEARKAALTRLISDTDTRFQALVAERRGLPAAKVASLADGKVYLGARALELGLVDGFGALPDAVAAARKHAGKAQNLPLEIYPRPGGLAAALGLGVQSRVLSELQLGLPLPVRHLQRVGGPAVWAWTPVSSVK